MTEFVLDDVPSHGFEIHTVWVWVAVDGAGEGIIETAIGSDRFPLVTTKLETAMAIEKFARVAARMSGKKARLIRLDNRTVVTEIEPAR